MLKKINIFIIVMMLPLSGYCLDFKNHLGIGLNIDNFKSDLPGNQDLEDDFRLSPTFGLKSSLFWGNIGVRSGVFLEYKKVNVDDDLESPGKDDIELTAWYAAIPINLQFNLNERWSIFGGIVPRVLLAKTCDNCGTFDDDSKNLVNYTNFGIGFEMTQKLSLDVSFQHAQNESFEGLKINTAQALLLYEL